MCCNTGLNHEYNIEIRMEMLPYEHIRWIENKELDPHTLTLTSDTKIVQDFKGNYLLLFANEWNIDWRISIMRVWFCQNLIVKRKKYE